MNITCFANKVLIGSYTVCDLGKIGSVILICENYDEAITKIYDMPNQYINIRKIYSNDIY